MYEWNVKIQLCKIHLYETKSEPLSIIQISLLKLTHVSYFRHSSKFTEQKLSHPAIQGEVTS